MKQGYGLIFDVDGLIADTEPLNARVTIRVLAEMFGLQGVRPEDFAAGYGKGAEAFVKAGARVHGLELNDAQAHAGAELRERYLAEAVRAEGLPAFPGVLDLIRSALGENGFRLAIATSATRELSEAILDAVKVPHQKMVYVSGSEVTKKKPDPQIFLIAIRRLGIEAARCIVFEDAPSGVQAARAAGARCVAVTNTVPAEELAGADRICDSLEEIDLNSLRALVD
ncbi:MAG: HAD family phosphatase [Sedimentisphaerales bacterium]|jgi:HAD superfamily hydrolase (TIGR01509 family)|nr:HAD family phosphatase [Sedimentisphaerales bacterium]HNY77967.1 HAD family phosphatase [Sedimentisphaerales bacterium]HOC63363.1 HAD family phosphatase [Sedimentisphaerales bacterium]HOH64107.1 HAD family phosphatase [Sedimentisphaerales bacterium]HPY48810.1 HAD family phosphatase [Sedimentisphaerales bacterium]